MLKSNFVVYFHDNHCSPMDEDWKPETYFKSDEFKTYNDVYNFIDNYLNKKNKILNIHQYRISFFDSLYNPSIDLYDGVINQDFGEFRIAIKYGLIYNSIKNQNNKWQPKVFWNTYENIPTIFKNLILLFINLDLKFYNLAGFTLIMKQDVVEFRWLMYKYEKDKYEKIKTLIRLFINNQINNETCPKQVKCYGFKDFENF